MDKVTISNFSLIVFDLGKLTLGGGHFEIKYCFQELLCGAYCHIRIGILLKKFNINP